MNTFKYILYTLLFTQIVSAVTLTTPKIIKIANNRPFSNTISVFYEDIYDENTSINVFDNLQPVTTLATDRNPNGIGEVSFAIKPKYNLYFINIQAVKGDNKSELSAGVSFSSLLKFQLSIAGRDSRTVVVGQPIILDGKVWNGDLDQIDRYSWEKDGKLLLNTANEEILYWDPVNSENAYIPTELGRYGLRFIATDIDGKQHFRTLALNVIEATALPATELHIGIKGVFNLRNNEVTMKLGESIALHGRLSRDKYLQIVDSYHWEKDGKILKNMLGDDILYWDVINQENGYKPTKVGVENLLFVVKDIYGNSVSKGMKVNVLRPEDVVDDYGDTQEDAKEIFLNQKINGKKDYTIDHDFFVFTLDKKQHIKVQLKYGGTVNKGAMLYTEGNPKGIFTHEGIPRTALYKPKDLFLEAGIYYLDVSIYTGGYSLKIETVK